MKKSTFLTTIALAFVMLLSVNVNAQKFAKLDKSPMDATAFPTSLLATKRLTNLLK